MDNPQTMLRRAKELTQSGLLNDMIDNHPLTTLASALALGTVIGRAVLPKSAQLVFLACAGFVGAEVWKAQGRVDGQELLRRIRGAIGAPAGERDEEKKQTA